MNINLKELVPLIERLKNEKRPIVLYGMGNGADKIIALCEKNGIKISGVFASDGFVRAKLFHGMPVMTFSAIKDIFGKDIVVLLAFATSRPEVLENIYRIANEVTLLAPDVPAYGENVFDAEFYRQHEAEINEVNSLLSDERSRELYRDLILYKLTGEIKYLDKTDSEDDYMNGILQSKDFCVFADAGAYKGDTARKQMQYSPNLKKIYAMEPDPKTFKKLCDEFEGENEIEFLPFNFGLSDTEKELSFRGDGGRGGSSAVEKGNKTARFKSLDSIIGDGHVDYIKYDVEGFEYEALIGSEKTIRRERPCMLVSLYHRSEDLFKLPLKVKELFPDSKLYLRRLSGIPAWDINLLAVPKKDN